MALVDSRTLGGRLALARSEIRVGTGLGRRGVSQAQLAEAIGVHRVTVSEWERSPQVHISSKHVIAICNFLNLESTWLLTGQGPMRPTPTSGKSFREAIDERLGAIRGALGLVLPAGNEVTRDLDAFASLAHCVASLGGSLFYIDEAYRGNHGCHAPIATAILESQRLAHYDRGFSGYLTDRFMELAALLDETAGLWLQWENGDLELEVGDAESVCFDQILKLPAPAEYQVVQRFTPALDPAVRDIPF